jgi:four helix bundle protein
MKLILSHKELDVYRLAYRLAMDIFHLSKKFPVEEKYSLTDQIRRSSRSVASNIAEAFRKRRYEMSMILQNTNRNENLIHANSIGYQVL